jgi:hypothetical protein
MLDPHRRSHPFLYEHHSGEQRFRRFLRTVSANLRPVKFWRSMRVTHLHRRGPLIAFASWVAVLAFAQILIAVLVLEVEWAKFESVLFGTMPLYDRMMDGLEIVLMGVVEFVIREYLNFVSPIQISIAMAVVVLPAPLTVFGFWLYSKTLSRYRILTRHFWRLTLFPAGTILLVFLPLAVIAGPLDQVAGGRGRPLLAPFDSQAFCKIVWDTVYVGLDGVMNQLGRTPFQMFVLAVSALFWFLSLLAGGTVYLQVPFRTWSIVVISSQIIMALAILNGLMLFQD